MKKLAVLMLAGVLLAGCGRGEQQMKAVTSGSPETIQFAVAWSANKCAETAARKATTTAPAAATADMRRKSLRVSLSMRPFLL